MKIAIDISPLESGHKVRGSGFYLAYLKRSLLQYYPDHSYTFFSGKKLEPADTDIVHYPYFDPFFLTLPLRKKNKTIVTIHDLIPLVFPEHFPAGIKGTIKWNIQKYALRSVEAVITDSEASKNDIVRYTGISDNKIHVVYLAAGDEFQPKADRHLEDRTENLKKKYQLPEKFVLYVGDATWNKNLHKLVEAIKEINLTLVMVGRALNEDNINQNLWNYELLRVQQFVKDDKRFIRLGFVSTEDLVSLYNLAAVFVMPSIYEGFGLPVLEAMRSGCPVVTTREGSLPEVTGDAVWYVDPYDVHGIAKGVGEVFLNGKLQKELSLKGLKQAEKFSWKKTAEQTNNIYEKIIAGK